MKFKIKAFTLIELIVAISIIAILATISYIMVQNYNKETRNVVRVSEINILEKALELHYIDSQKYPDPDNYTELYSS